MVANKAKPRIAYRMLGLEVGEVTGGPLDFELTALLQHSEFQIQRKHE